MSEGIGTRGPVTPSSPPEVLAPYLAERLHRPDGTAARTVRSDFDLNPAGRPAARDLAPAAVLVGLIEREEGLSVLLTRRADTLRRHSGQVAFPGGRMEAGETPVETALRETFEEIGLTEDFIRVVGLGDTHETGTGFSITPVVAFIRPGFTLQPHDAEVAEVFETPFAFLMDPANHELRVMQTPDGIERRFYAMPYQERNIWGATAGMIRALQERLFG